MNKILISSLTILVTFSANVAAAQSYYPTYTYGTTYAQPYSGTPYAQPYGGTLPSQTGCVNLVSDLSYGAQGPQVSLLQTFLVSRNYPGGGSWMITGNFRTATLTAVRNFQTEQRLPQTGIVDAPTRAAIAQVSCGGYAGGYNMYNYNTYNTYPYTYPAASTYPYNNNYSYNNTNCYYTYPYTCNTNYNYNNTNCSYTYPYVGYQYQNQYGYPYCPPQGDAPSITSVNGPTSLDTGEEGSWRVKVKNRNDSYVITSVNWGDTGFGYVNTSAPQTTYGEGTDTLTFTHAYFTPGTYTIVFTVSNGAGQQDTESESVRVSNSGNSGDVSLSYLSPNHGYVGTQIMLQGSGFNAFDNTVHFGIGGTLHVPSFNNGTTIYYTVPSYVSPCDLVTSGSNTVCAQSIQQVMPGPIQVYVTNSDGTSQTLMFQVN